jgi:hypothetical protein
MAQCCENSNVPSGSIEGEELFFQLSGCLYLMKYSGTRNYLVSGNASLLTFTGCEQLTSSAFVCDNISCVLRI